MAADMIKINGDTWVLREDIRSVSPVSEEERARVVERYGEKAARFQSRLMIKGNDRPIMAEETVEQLDAQGLALVTVRGGVKVPADNIGLPKTFTKDEADAMSARGYKLKTTFRASVEVLGQSMLSTATPKQILERKAAARARMRDMAIGGSDIDAAPAADSGVA